jgi:DNA-binding transcriptional LysR family regulator
MDIRRSDLPLLISLDVLLEERNVTKAAKRLHISQPALSAQLGRLRHLFDDPLLVPSEAGRGMVPTAKALALQSRLHHALMAVQDAVQLPETFDPGMEARHFVIAINDNVFTIIGMAVAQAVLAHYSPNIRLSFITPEETNLVYGMERGEIDPVPGPAGQDPRCPARAASGDRHLQGGAAPRASAWPGSAVPGRVLPACARDGVPAGHASQQHRRRLGGAGCAARGSHHGVELQPGAAGVGRYRLHHDAAKPVAAAICIRPGYLRAATAPACL